MLSRDIDPVKFELIKKSLSFVVNDMALTVIRSAYSGIIKDNMDFSTAICDERGQMVAQGLALVQFGSIPDAMEAVLKHYQGRIYVEDIFVLNDPFDGGTHLPDIFLLKPIFIEDRLEFFSAVVGHHLDVGGRVAGGNACDSTEVFQEGLRIGPLKFYERGIPNQTLISLIGTNVRKPRTMLGDLRAKISALRTGESGVLKLVERYDITALKRYCHELLDYSERMARSNLEICLMDNGSSWTSSMTMA